VPLMQEGKKARMTEAHARSRAVSPSRIGGTFPLIHRRVAMPTQKEREAVTQEAAQSLCFMLSGTRESNGDIAKKTIKVLREKEGEIYIYIYIYIYAEAERE